MSAVQGTNLGSPTEKMNEKTCGTQEAESPANPWSIKKEPMDQCTSILPHIHDNEPVNPMERNEAMSASEASKSVPSIFVRITTEPKEHVSSGEPETQNSAIRKDGNAMIFPSEASKSETPNSVRIKTEPLEEIAGFFQEMGSNDHGILMVTKGPPAFSEASKSVPSNSVAIYTESLETIVSSYAGEMTNNSRGTSINAIETLCTREAPMSETSNSERIKTEPLEDIFSCILNTGNIGRGNPKDANNPTAIIEASTSLPSICVGINNEPIKDVSSCVPENPNNVTEIPMEASEGLKSQTPNSVRVKTEPIDHVPEAGQIESGISMDTRDQPVASEAWKIVASNSLGINTESLKNVPNGVPENPNSDSGPPIDASTTSASLEAANFLSVIRLCVKKEPIEQDSSHLPEERNKEPGTLLDRNDSTSTNEDLEVAAVPVRIKSEPIEREPQSSTIHKSAESGVNTNTIVPFAGLSPQTERKFVSDAATLLSTFAVKETTHPTEVTTTPVTTLQAVEILSAFAVANAGERATPVAASVSEVVMPSTETAIASVAKTPLSTLAGNETEPTTVLSTSLVNIGGPAHYSPDVPVRIKPEPMDVEDIDNLPDDFFDDLISNAEDIKVPMPPMAPIVASSTQVTDSHNEVVAPARIKNEVPEPEPDPVPENFFDDLLNDLMPECTADDDELEIKYSARLKELEQLCSMEKYLKKQKKAMKKARKRARSRSRSCSPTAEPQEKQRRSRSRSVELVANDANREFVDLSNDLTAAKLPDSGLDAPRPMLRVRAEFRDKPASPTPDDSAARLLLQVRADFRSFSPPFGDGDVECLSVRAYSPMWHDGESAADADCISLGTFRPVRVRDEQSEANKPEPKLTPQQKREKVIKGAQAVLKLMRKRPQDSKAAKFTYTATSRITTDASDEFRSPLYSVQNPKYKFNSRSEFDLKVWGIEELSSTLADIAEKVNMSIEMFKAKEAATNFTAIVPLILAENEKPTSAAVDRTGCNSDRMMQSINVLSPDNEAAECMDASRATLLQNAKNIGTTNFGPILRKIKVEKLEENNTMTESHTELFSRRLRNRGQTRNETAANDDLTCRKDSYQKAPSTDSVSTQTSKSAENLPIWRRLNVLTPSQLGAANKFIELMLHPPNPTPSNAQKLQKHLMGLFLSTMSRSYTEQCSGGSASRGAVSPGCVEHKSQLNAPPELPSYSGRDPRASLGHGYAEHKPKLRAAPAIPGDPRVHEYAEYKPKLHAASEMRADPRGILPHGYAEHKPKLRTAPDLRPSVSDPRAQAKHGYAQHILKLPAAPEMRSRDPRGKVAHVYDEQKPIYLAAPELRPTTGRDPRAIIAHGYVEQKPNLQDTPKLRANSGRPRGMLIEGRMNPDPRLRQTQTKDDKSFVMRGYEHVEFKPA